MKKAQISTGKHYAIRHHNDSLDSLSVVRVDVYRCGEWDCTKLSTGRTIRVKSAAKFRYEVVLNPHPGPGKPKWVTVERAAELQKESAQTSMEV